MGTTDTDIPRSVDKMFFTTSSRADVAVYCPGDDVSGHGYYPMYINGTYFANISVSGTGTSPNITLTQFTPIRPSYLSQSFIDYNGNFQQYPAGPSGPPGEYLDFFQLTISGIDMNGVSFGGEDSYFASIDIGSVNEWRLTNLEGIHPFHMHVNHFQLIEMESQGDNIPQGWFEIGDFYDTMYGAGTIRFQADLWGGTMLTHCHILRHEDEGAMATFEIIGGCENDLSSSYGVVSDDPSSYYCNYTCPIATTRIPTMLSTNNPTNIPTCRPTRRPTRPTDMNTSSQQPTISPTTTPTTSPTVTSATTPKPSELPTTVPTVIDDPTAVPSLSPMATINPSSYPTVIPSFGHRPSIYPSNMRTVAQVSSTMSTTLVTSVMQTNVPSDHPTSPPVDSSTTPTIVTTDYSIDDMLTSRASTVTNDTGHDARYTIEISMRAGYAVNSNGTMKINETRMRNGVYAIFCHLIENDGSARQDASSSASSNSEIGSRLAGIDDGNFTISLKYKNDDVNLTLLFEFTITTKSISDSLIYENYLESNQFSTDFIDDIEIEFGDIFSDIIIADCVTVTDDTNNDVIHDCYDDNYDNYNWTNETSQFESTENIVVIMNENPGNDQTTPITIDDDSDKKKDSLLGLNVDLVTLILAGSAVIVVLLASVFFCWDCLCKRGNDNEMDQDIWAKTMSSNYNLNGKFKGERVPRVSTTATATCTGTRSRTTSQFDVDNSRDSRTSVHVVYNRRVTLTIIDPDVNVSDNNQDENGDDREFEEFQALSPKNNSNDNSLNNDHHDDTDDNSPTPSNHLDVLRLELYNKDGISTAI